MATGKSSFTQQVHVHDAGIWLKNIEPVFDGELSIGSQSKVSGSYITWQITIPVTFAASEKNIEPILRPCLQGSKFLLASSNGLFL